MTTEQLEQENEELYSALESAHVVICDALGIECDDDDADDDTDDDADDE